VSPFVILKDIILICRLPLFLLLRFSDDLFRRTFDAAPWPTSSLFVRVFLLADLVPSGPILQEAYEEEMESPWSFLEVRLSVVCLVISL